MCHILGDFHRVSVVDPTIGSNLTPPHTHTSRTSIRTSHTSFCPHFFSKAQRRSLPDSKGKGSCFTGVCTELEGESFPYHECLNEMTENSETTTECPLEHGFIRNICTRGRSFNPTNLWEIQFKSF